MSTTATVLTEATTTPAAGKGDTTTAAPPIKQDGTQAKPADGVVQTKTETTTEGKKPEGDGADKSTEKKADDKPAPSKIELKFPDGVKPDAELVSSYVKKAEELGLTPEAAQALADTFLGSQKAADEKFRVTWEQTQAKWKTEVEGDKEFGGDKLKASKTDVAKAVAKFGEKALTELFADPDIGNHPALFRFIARVGRSLGEDTVSGTATAPVNGALTEEQRLREMYPNSPSMFPSK